MFSTHLYNLGFLVANNKWCIDVNSSLNYVFKMDIDVPLVDHFAYYRTWGRIVQFSSEVVIHVKAVSNGSEIPFLELLDLILSFFLHYPCCIHVMNCSQNVTCIRFSGRDYILLDSWNEVSTCF